MATLKKRNSLNSQESVSPGYAWTSVIFFCVHAQKEQICIVSYISQGQSVTIIETRCDRDVGISGSACERHIGAPF